MPVAAGRSLDLRRLLRIVAVCLLVLGAWLLVPAPLGQAELRPPARIAVVDASASARRPRPEWSRWVRRCLREEAERARASGEEFAVVSFAREVAKSGEPAPPEEFLAHLVGASGGPFDPRAGAGPDEESRLAAALEVASALVAPGDRRSGTIVLVGCDTWTGRDPFPALVALERAGVRRERVPLPPAELPDLALRKLTLPPQVEEGAPLTGVARIAHVPGRSGGASLTGAALEVEIENAGRVRMLRLPLALGPEPAVLDVPLALGEAGFGRTEVRARVRSDAPDPVPENDRAEAATLAAGELVVLVAAEPDRLADASAWLTPSGASLLPGLQFRFAALAELPFLVDEVDALITFDVPLRSLPERQLERFLADGGGWLVTSGSRFLDDWVPGGSDAGAHALLPLVPAPLDGGPRDVLLLVDGSGSMEGEPFETVRTACLDLVAAALPTDRVELRFFMTRLRDPHLVKPREDDARGRSAPEGSGSARRDAAARRLLELTVPSGDTRIMDSLELLAAERRSAVHEGLVLLLTDGLERQTSLDPEGRAGALLAELASSRTKLQPIAIGRNADLDFLARLVRPGDEVLVPEGLDDLRSIFRRAVDGARCREGAALEIDWAPAEADSLAAELRSGTPAALAPLLRFVKNRARPGAEVLWQSDRGEPVLAAGRVGLGRAVVFSSLPFAGWGADWTRRSGLGEPAAFGALLRWLARRPVRSADGPRLEFRSGPEPAFRLSGLDSAWPAEVELRVLADASRASRVVQRVPLVPPAKGAGRDPLTERVGPAALPLLSELARAGTPFLEVEGPTRLLVPLELGVPLEFSGAARSLGALLAERAVSDGGTELSAPGGVARQEGHPTGPWVLSLGLLCLFVGFLPRRGRSREGKRPLTGGDGQGIAASGR